MSSQPRTKRQAAPEKFEERPGIPEENEADDTPLNEDEILEGSDDESSDVGSFADSDDGSDVELVGEVSEKKTEGREKAKSAPKSQAKSTAKTPAGPKGKAAAKPKVSPKAAAKPKAKPAPKANAKQSKGKADSEDGDEVPGKRYFKIVINSIKPEGSSPVLDVETLSANGGRYTGNNPMQAAKKAFTRISRLASEKGECTYVFSMQETTQSSLKKEFPYRGVRHELDEPQEVTKGETSYFIKFRTEVRAYKPNGSKSKAPAKAAATGAKPTKSKPAAAKAKPVAAKGKPTKTEKPTTPSVDAADVNTPVEPETKVEEKPSLNVESEKKSGTGRGGKPSSSRGGRGSARGSGGPPRGGRGRGKK